MTNKLITQLKVNKIWTSYGTLGKLFNVSVKNNSSCKIEILLSANDPVYGTVMLLSSNVETDEDSIELNGSGTVNFWVTKDEGLGEIPVDRVSLEWILVTPSPGELRGCEDINVTTE